MGARDIVWHDSARWFERRDLRRREDMQASGVTRPRVRKRARRDAGEHPDPCLCRACEGEREIERQAAENDHGEGA